MRIASQITRWPLRLRTLPSMGTTFMSGGIGNLVRRLASLMILLAAAHVVQAKSPSIPPLIHVPLGSGITRAGPIPSE